MNLREIEITAIGDTSMTEKETDELFGKNSYYGRGFYIMLSHFLFDKQEPRKVRVENVNIKMLDICSILLKLYGSKINSEILKFQSLVFEIVLSQKEKDEIIEEDSDNHILVFFNDDFLITEYSSLKDLQNIGLEIDQVNYNDLPLRLLRMIKDNNLINIENHGKSGVKITNPGGYKGRKTILTSEIFSVAKYPNISLSDLKLASYQQINPARLKTEKENFKLLTLSAISNLFIKLSNTSRQGVIFTLLGFPNFHRKDEDVLVVFSIDSINLQIFQLFKSKHKFKTDIVITKKDGTFVTNSSIRHATYEKSFKDRDTLYVNIGGFINLFDQNLLGFGESVKSICETFKISEEDLYLSSSSKI